MRARWRLLRSLNVRLGRRRRNTRNKWNNVSKADTKSGFIIICSYTRNTWFLEYPMNECGDTWRPISSNNTYEAITTIIANYSTWFRTIHDFRLELERVHSPLCMRAKQIDSRFSPFPFFLRSVSSTRRQFQHTEITGNTWCCSVLLDKLVSVSVYWILKVCTYLTMSWFVCLLRVRVYCFCGGGNLFGADQRPSSDSFVCAFHNASVLVFVVYLI